MNQQRLYVHVFPELMNTEKILTLGDVNAFLDKKLKKFISDQDIRIIDVKPLDYGRLGPEKVGLHGRNVGRMSIDDELNQVTGMCEFSSLRTDVCVYAGKWMYEIRLNSRGVMQLGWCTSGCTFNDENGVGDTQDSYGYDGFRIKLWNVLSRHYGEAWEIGDVITCCIDLDEGKLEYFRNGRSMGVAYDKVKIGPRVAYFPAVSISEKDMITLNFGEFEFYHTVEGFKPIQHQNQEEIATVKCLMGYWERLIPIAAEVIKNTTNSNQDSNQPIFSVGNISNEIVNSNVSEICIESSNISVKSFCWLLASTLLKRMGPLLLKRHISDSCLIPFLMKFCDTSIVHTNQTHVSLILDQIWNLYEHDMSQKIIKTLLDGITSLYEFGKLDEMFSTQTKCLYLVLAIVKHHTTKMYMLENKLFEKTRLANLMHNRIPDEELLCKLVSDPGQQYWGYPICVQQDNCIKHRPGAFPNIPKMIEGHFNDPHLKNHYTQSIQKMRIKIRELEDIQDEILIQFTNSSNPHDEEANLRIRTIFLQQLYRLIRKYINPQSSSSYNSSILMSFCHRLVNLVRVMWKEGEKKYSNVQTQFEDLSIPLIMYTMPPNICLQLNTQRLGGLFTNLSKKHKTIIDSYIDNSKKSKWSSKGRLNIFKSSDLQKLLPDSKSKKNSSSIIIEELVLKEHYLASSILNSPQSTESSKGNDSSKFPPPLPPKIQHTSRLLPLTSPFSSSNNRSASSNNAYTNVSSRKQPTRTTTTSSSSSSSPPIPQRPLITNASVSSDTPPPSPPPPPPPPVNTNYFMPSDDFNDFEALSRLHARNSTTGIIQTQPLALFNGLSSELAVENRTDNSMSETNLSERELSMSGNNIATMTTDTLSMGASGSSMDAVSGITNATTNSSSSLAGLIDTGSSSTTHGGITSESNLVRFLRSYIGGIDGAISMNHSLFPNTSTNNGPLSCKIDHVLGHITSCLQLVEAIIALFSLAVDDHYFRVVLNTRQQAHNLVSSVIHVADRLERSPNDEVYLKEILTQSMETLQKKLVLVTRKLAFVTATELSEEKRNNILWIWSVILTTFDECKSRELFMFIPTYHIENSLSIFRLMTQVFHPTLELEGMRDCNFVIGQYGMMLLHNYRNKFTSHSNLKSQLVKAISEYLNFQLALASLEQKITQESAIEFLEELTTDWADSMIILEKIWRGNGFAFRYQDLPHQQTPDFYLRDATMKLIEKPNPSKKFQMCLKNLLKSKPQLCTKFIDLILSKINWSFSEVVGNMQELNQYRGNRTDRLFDIRFSRTCSICFDIIIPFLRILEMIVTIMPQIFVDPTRPNSELFLNRLLSSISLIFNRCLSKGLFRNIINFKLNGLDQIDLFPIITAGLGVLVAIIIEAPKQLPKMTSSEKLVDIMARESNFMQQTFDKISVEKLEPELIEGESNSNDTKTTESKNSENFKFNLRNYCPKYISEEEVEQVGYMLELILRISRGLESKTNQDDENICVICYAHPRSTIFKPCGHSTCKNCISYQMMTNPICFFCKVEIKKVEDLSGKDLHIKPSKP